MLVLIFETILLHEMTFFLSTIHYITYNSEFKFVSTSFPLDRTVYDEQGNILVVFNLWKIYNTFAALSGVSFTVGAGECLGLLGMDGSGRTTTLQIIAGEETPTSGDVYYDKKCLRHNKLKVRILFIRF